MLFNNLDDWEAGRCDDCTTHRGALECRGCQFEPPPIAGQSDTERTARLDAQRVTLEFDSRSTRRLDRGREPIMNSPLFGGPAQGDLFG